MPFGEIFTGAFARIWRHKKLWLFAMIGLGLSGLGSLVSALASARWMSTYFAFLNRMMQGQFAAPQTLLANMFGMVTAGLAFVALLGIVGYIINLVARGAIINEAAYAWRGETTETGRGLRRGLGRAVYVFLIDLIWWLPAIFLIFTGIVAFILLVSASVAASRNDSGGGFIATSWLAFICCGGCVGLLYYLAYVIFSPLMYQSAVAGDRDFGDAVREGWSLARANLGSMIIFWLLLLLVGIVLSAIVQGISLMFSLPLTAGLMGAFTSGVQGLSRGAAPLIPTSAGPLLALLALVLAVLSFLINTFMQTLGLTVYSGAYQHLAGSGLVQLPAAPTASAPVAPPPSEPVVPAADLPAADMPAADAPIVPPPPPPSEDELPPSL